MTSSDIVTRALGLIDLPNTKAISYTDKSNSLNESFTDIYNTMIQSNDDYFLTEVQFTVTTANAGTGPYEFLYPLPANFFQIRYLDYYGPQGWTSVKKFNMGTKDDLLVEPEYRFQNNNLWIVMGQASAGIPLKMRLGYYPPPFNITLPDTPIQYGLSYTQSNFTLINPNTPFFYHYAGVTDNTSLDAMFYVYNGKSIVVEISQNANAGQPITPITVWVEPTYNVIGLYYYKGTLYWANSGGGIFYATLDITNPALIGASTQLIGAGSLKYVHVFNNTVYYSTTTLTWQISTAGAGDTKFLPVPTTNITIFPNGNVYYVGNGDTLVANTPSGPTVVLTNAVDVANDRSNNLYVLDNTNNLWVYPVVSFGVLGTPVLISTDVSTQLGNWNNNRLPIITQEGQTLQALSAYPNFDFSTYNNIVLDIIKWRLAMDFGIKFGRIDLGAFQARLTELWTKFRNMVRRDEYKVERVQNYYKQFQSGIYA